MKKIKLFLNKHSYSVFACTLLLVAFAFFHVTANPTKTVIGNDLYVPGNIVAGGGINFSPEMLHIQHRLSGTTNPGTFTAGAWRRRPVNHVRWNTIEGASFNSGAYTFTLPKGTYWMDLYSTGFYVQNNTIRLYDLTLNQVIDYGDAGLSNPTAGYNNSGSRFQGYVVLNSQTTLAVDHWGTTTRDKDGFGYRNVATGEAVAIYANYMIWKVSD